MKDFNPQILYPQQFTTTVYLGSGHRELIDPAQLRQYLESIVRAVNHNASVMEDAADFVTWAVAYKPDLIPEYRAHMVAERLNK